MVWTLHMDDYMGTFCNQEKYPLINILEKGLNLEKACKNFSTFTIDDESKIHIFDKHYFLGVFSLCPTCYSPSSDCWNEQDYQRQLWRKLQWRLEWRQLPWTVGSALGRPMACSLTQQTRSNSATRATARPTVTTVLLVWSLIAPVLLQHGPKAESYRLTG